MEEEDFPEKGMNASDMRWMANLPDELEVCIAQREFESAVAYVEKGKFGTDYPLAKDFWDLYNTTCNANKPKS